MRKSVPGYPDYEVSDTGDVYKLATVVEQESSKGLTYSRVIREHRLSPVNNGIGYLQVSLKVGTRWVKRYVHVLVATCFVDGYTDGYEVHHIDSDKTNNKAVNLKWVSHSENQREMAVQNPHIVDNLRRKSP